MMGSPLMIGCDIRNANQVTKDILQNKDLLAINQDPEARGAYRIKVEPQWFHEDEAFVLVKALQNGDLAIGLYNFSDTQRELTVQFWDMGIPAASGAALSMYDCWEHKELGTFTERFAPTIEPHDCLVVRAKVVER
jgi:alpha-galactosidase